MTKTRRKTNGWIGYDLDRTLAEYHGYQGPDHIGTPIPSMIARVKQDLDKGEDVRIFTARVFIPNNPTERDLEFVRLAHTAIEDFCLDNFGQRLTITCCKDLECKRIYDDLAIAVEANTGRILGGNL